MRSRSRWVSMLAMLVGLLGAAGCQVILGIEDPVAGVGDDVVEADGGADASGGPAPDANPGFVPGPGPGPACPSLPPRDCTTGCADLIVFDPRTTAAWDDYPINGETSGNQYRSHLRRDLVMLVQYATSKVACKSAGWPGSAAPLGLGDMSEANGAIPGTSLGAPAHPAGTHTNGKDLDLAYYQIGTADNQLRAVCAHDVSGTDQYHCVGPADALAVWRTALLVGVLFENDLLRVIGVDGVIGPELDAAVAQLCTDGWIDAAACARVQVAYEATDTGLGWYLSRHHSAHLSSR